MAFVSDSAGPAAAFAACDLSIGVFAGQREFPARADLLAPGLRTVAAVVEAGARRANAVRDSVVLSAIANAAGIVWGFSGARGVEEATRVVFALALAAIADGWLWLRGGRRPERDIE